MNSSDNLSITENGKTYLFQRTDGETLENFHLRAWLTVRQNPKTKDEYQLFNRNARIWINNQILNCRYSPEIEKMVAELKEKIYQY